MYALKETLIAFRRAKGATLISVVSIIFSLTVFGVFLAVTFNLYELAQNLRKRVVLEAYLSDKVDESQAITLKHKLAKISGVDKITYVSKEMAAEEFKKDFGINLLETVSINPLPSSLRFDLKPGYRTAERASKIATLIKKEAGIEEVDYGGEWVVLLDRAILIMLAIDVGIGIVISIASLFVISNTIHLTVLSRRDSIEIMKLVGATNRFIRRPFVLEGLIQGTLGGAFSAAILYGAGYVIQYYFPDLIFTDTLLPALALIPLGFFLGGTGSTFSVRRILRNIGT